MASQYRANIEFNCSIVDKSNNNVLYNIYNTEFIYRILDDEKIAGMLTKAIYEALIENKDKINNDINNGKSLEMHFKSVDKDDTLEIKEVHSKQKVITSYNMDCIRKEVDKIIDNLTRSIIRECIHRRYPREIEEFHYE